MRFVIIIHTDRSIGLHPFVLLATHTDSRSIFVFGDNLLFNTGGFPAWYLIRGTQQTATFRYTNPVSLLQASRARDDARNHSASLLPAILCREVIAQQRGKYTAQKYLLLMF